MCKYCWCRFCDKTLPENDEVISIEESKFWGKDGYAYCDEECYNKETMRVRKERKEYLKENNLSSEDESDQE